MKDTRQVASEVLSKLPAQLKGEIVNWSAAIDEAVYNCMKEYAREALDELVPQLHSELANWASKLEAFKQELK